MNAQNNIFNRPALDFFDFVEKRATHHTTFSERSVAQTTVEVLGNPYSRMQLRQVSPVKKLIEFKDLTFRYGSYAIYDDDYCMIDQTTAHDPVGFFNVDRYCRLSPKPDFTMRITPPKKIKRLTGKYFVIPTNWGHGHFMEAFSRLMLAKHLNIAPDTSILVSQNCTKYLAAFEELIGFPKGTKITIMEPETAYEVEHVLYASSLFTEPALDPLFGELLKKYAHKKLAPLHAKKDKKIFISREGAGVKRRRIENFAEVEACLHAKGFETLNPEEVPFAEQVELFASCKMVIGQYGSGIINTIFCGEGTNIIEFMGLKQLKYAPLSTTTHPMMSKHLGLKHAWILCPQTHPDTSTEIRHKDIIVDVEELDKLAI
ncbi:MAG: glycosyltransferase family 61 protein [Alphaproteobacteria bacterium]